MLAPSPALVVVASAFVGTTLAIVGALLVRGLACSNSAVAAEFALGDR